MNFSDPIHSAIGLTHASPNAQFIGSASQHELIVRLSSNVQVIRLYDCLDIIHSFSWSPDSLYIMCLLKKRCIVQVFSIENPEWTCKVDEGSAGLLSAAWAPDSQHFLTTTEFYIRINVWSLSEVLVCYLKHAKACSGNFAFSPGGRYLALLERRSFHDYLSIFDCRADWNLLRNFQLDTHDSDGLLWSPDGRYLVIWDGCLHYRAAVYTLDGRHLHTFSAYEPGRDFLGIKSVCWSPTGQLLAIGSYDQKCRILNHFNWSCLASLAHPVDQSINPYLGLGPSGRVLHLDDNIGPGVSDHPLHNYRPHRVDVYEEVRHEQQAQSVAYCLRSEPITIQSIRVDPKLPFPKVGIGLVAFSSDGRYLATRNDNAPHVVWLWSIDHRISLFSLLVHTSGPVRSLAWDSSSPARLALCTASDCFFMWTPQGCLVVQVPANFNFVVCSLVWLQSGDALILKSESHFCVCYLDAEDVDRYRPSWKPPIHHAITRTSNFALDTPLPIGVFGHHERDDSYLTDSILDGPKWLKQHGDTEIREQHNPKKPQVGRRSISSNNSLGRGTTVPTRPSTRAISVTSATRQAWVAPTPNTRLCPKSGGRRNPKNS